MKKLILLLLLLPLTASAQFPMVAAWQGETRIPLVTDSLSGLFIAGDVIDSLGKSSGDTTYLLPNRARWFNSYAFDNAYQTTPSSKPIVYDSSGARYLSFDGVDDFIRAAPRGQHAQPYTMILLAYAYYGPANGALYCSATGDAAIRSYTLVLAPAASSVFHAGVNVGYVRNDSLYTWRFIANSATSAVTLNGALRASGNIGTEGVDGLTFGAFTTGASNRFRGYIYGAAFYHKALTDEEATAVETWLREECLQ